MRVALAVVASLLLAGCVSGDPPASPARDGFTPKSDACVSDCGTDTPQPAGEPSQSAPQRMAIQGMVLDEALRPIPTAAVALQELGLTRNVTSSGTFRFDDLVPSTYFLTASAPGHASKTLSVDPATAAKTLEFVLAKLPGDTPVNKTLHFRGHLQCALEALIISPACDTIITADPINQDPVLNDTFSAQLPVEANWKTVVVDVIFDPEAQPGLDGLRVTVRGAADTHELGTYVDYGKFVGKEPFTFRVSPGEQYEGGENPVPANTTLFQLDTYPHSHGWHAVCSPSGDPCFLGVGAGLDVEFDLYMTVFYGEPAPEGWTKRE